MPSGVPVTGTITTYAGGTYATIDPTTGIDGWRSVATTTVRNAITTARRRQGMAVWVQADGSLWTLNAGPWAGDDTDWTQFTGGGGGLPSGTAGQVLIIDDATPAFSSIIEVYSATSPNATGVNSTALNATSEASGEASHADSGGQANNEDSHADSRGTASGDGSHADSNGETGGEGSHADSSGQADGANSHADSHGAASEESSHADSYGTASSVNSHADSNGTVNATYTSSHANSTGTISANYSHADSGGTVDIGGQNSHAEGSSTVSAAYAHGEGKSTTASGEASHVEGKNNEANARGAHAEGEFTTASGEASHAEGQGTTASGTAAHAEGSSPLASGYAAHAEGENTTAGGEASHAEGSGSGSYGFGSHAEGESLAIGDSSHAEGGAASYGNHGHGEGTNSTGAGEASHAEGENCWAGPTPWTCSLATTGGVTVATITGSTEAATWFAHLDHIVLFSMSGGTGSNFVTAIVDTSAVVGGDSVITLTAEVTDATAGQIFVPAKVKRGHAGGLNSFADLPTKFARSDGGFWNGSSNPSGSTGAASTCLSVKTTDDTETELRIGGGVGASPTPIRFLIADGFTYGFELSLVARKSDGSAGALMRRQGLIHRDSGTVSLIGAIGTLGADINTPGWVLAITADNTNKSLKVTGTGVAATTILWFAELRTWEVGLPAGPFRTAPYG